MPNPKKCIRNNSIPISNAGGISMSIRLHLTNQEHSSTFAEEVVENCAGSELVGEVERLGLCAGGQRRYHGQSHQNGKDQQHSESHGQHRWASWGSGSGGRCRFHCWMKVLKVKDWRTSKNWCEVKKAFEFRKVMLHHSIGRLIYNKFPISNYFW